jgi:hypothetical protein
VQQQTQPSPPLATIQVGLFDEVVIDSSRVGCAK